MPRVSQSNPERRPDRSGFRSSIWRIMTVSIWGWQTEGCFKYRQNVTIALLLFLLFAGRKHKMRSKYFGNVRVSNFPFISVFVRFCFEHFFWLLRYLKENQNQTNSTINTQNKDVISSALNDWTFSLAATLFRQVPPVLWPETAGDRRWHDWWHTVVD